MSPTHADIAAREALRARQGKGARYDAPNAPAEDLLLARRGTSFFARKLGELDDAGLYQPSAIQGLTRAHIVARVSYEARAEALALDALAGRDAPSDEPLPDLALAATLPARALRHLFRHAEVHLNVCWRDLTAEDWDRTVTLPDGTRLPARALPIRRARSIWQGAVDLGNGATFSDIPEELRLMSL